MFPKQYRSHPDIKDLYRAYLNSRHQVKSKIKRNIDVEVRRNPFHLVAEQEGQQSIPSSSAQPTIEEDDMDIEDVDKHLTLDQAIQELTTAEKIYKEEVTRLKDNLDHQMESIRLPSSASIDVDEEALMLNLKDLIGLCDSITEGVSSK
ncbi:hypothetical protein BGZ94_002909 [Podila epigama]|nr:hypothetical protein BGZ94_002909 [Podila epigama]